MLVPCPRESGAEWALWSSNREWLAGHAAADADDDDEAEAKAETAKETASRFSIV